MNHLGKFILAVLTTCIAFLTSTSIAQDSSNLPYMNPKLSPEQRASDLVHRMTLAEKASQMQNNSAAVARLKIPAYQWWSEALHGVAVEGTTEFPEPIGLAATFDTDGIHMKWGIVFRREVLLNYSRIQDIHLRSNLIERWLGLSRYVLIRKYADTSGAARTRNPGDISRGETPKASG